VDAERWRRIERLYHAAAEKEEARRAEFLREACGEDEELRREVESLLALEAAAEDFIEAPALEKAARRLAREEEASLVGRRIGAYRILSPLGAGGMGEVYLAEDSSLGRKVALKFLPESLRHDELAHKRFLREAHAAATLEHPFICNIKEVVRTEEGDDVIVMEYVEGRTLKDVLAEGPLPLKAALQVGVEIAEALEVAHRKGIVHRDLKPANLILTTQGHTKIMDFGLAKRVITEEGKEEDLSSALTREGSTLGTPAYMSPEQIRAQPVDHRSDIFSFGILLYEMLAGVHPFRKATLSETTGAILHEEPVRLETYAEEAPEILQHTVGKMLAKDPDQRFQSVREIRADLEGVRETFGLQSVRSWRTWGRYSGRRSWLVLSISAVAVATVTAAILLHWIPIGETLFGPGPADKTRMTLDFSAAPRHLTTLPGIERDPAVSPDGNRVAFAWNGGGDGYFHIYVMPLGGGEPLQITRADADDVRPVWSPRDGRLAFIRRSRGDLQIWWVPFPAGKEKLFYTFRRSDELGDPGMDWSPDGRYLVVGDSAGEDRRAIFLIDVSSSDVTQLTFPPPEAAGGDFRPVFSPDGTEVAFLREYLPGSLTISIHTQSIEDGKPSGVPKQVLPTREPVSDLAWSPDGSELLYTDRYSLWRVVRDEGQPQIVPQAQNAYFLAADRAGLRLIYSASREDWDIWRMPGPEAVGTFKPEPFIRSTRNEGHPKYSPDGAYVAFNSDRSGAWNVWLADADGSNQRQMTDRPHAIQPQWSPAGDKLAFHGYLGGGVAEIFLIGLDDAQPTAVTGEPTNQGMPVWSPDGEWIYYNRRSEVHGDAEPEWQIWRVRPDGSESQKIAGGGLAPFLVDDRFVYFVRPTRTKLHGWTIDQVCRAPVEGGEAGLVLEAPIVRNEHDLWGTKLFYFDRFYPDGATLRSFDLTTGETANVAPLGSDVATAPAGTDLTVFISSGLTVSPDGKWILYGRPTIAEADLMVIDAVP
jgi:eukaryotic-like serine/threonine-protein kinase